MKLLHSLALLPLTFAAVTASPPAMAEEAPSRWIDIEVGKSYIHRETREITRLVASDPEIAEIKGLRPGQFQVRGVSVGSTDLWVWYNDDQDHPVVYQITVHQDLSDFIRRVDQTVGSKPPRVYPLADRLVVEGEVQDVETLERVANIARIYDDKFINLMTVAGDNQVQLNVVFAEVSRSGLRELGFNYGLVGEESFLSMITPGGTSTLTAGPAQKPYNFAPFADSGNNIQGNLDVAAAGAYTVMGAQAIGSYALVSMLNALEENSLTKVLAQPTLVALSGQKAEFLAGGETPIALATRDTISVDYKDYGVKLVFVPTVLAGDVVDLRVFAEVSELDPSTSVAIGSTVLPGLLVRKASSHLRLGNGTTFAMAGMLSETTSYTRQAVPLLGEIPLIGALFRSTSHARDERELVMFVTPKLVRPLGVGEVPPAPGTTENNNPNDFEFFLMGMDHAAGSRTAQPTGPIGLER